MARARPTPPAAKSGQPLPADSPEIRPPRKRPLLLALSIVLLAGWLVFMTLMAWRG